jgi:CheY-like chemotaxis protein
MSTRQEEAMTVTVVVVEDDHIEAEAIRRGVRRLALGWRVLVYQNGLQALLALRMLGGGGSIGEPYVILLDLNMPQMNGIEFLTELRADPELRDARAFVLTTSDDPNDVAAARRLQVDGYFKKASSGEDYVDALASVQEAFRSRN